MTRWTNADAMHRHAWKAYQDFSQLRYRRRDEALWHSLSHHIRHLVYRTGLDAKREKHHYVRRHKP